MFVSRPSRVVITGEPGSPMLNVYVYFGYRQDFLSPEAESLGSLFIAYVWLEHLIV